MKEYSSKYFDYRVETKKFLKAYREQKAHAKQLERDIEDKYETAQKITPAYSSQPIGHESNTEDRIPPGAKLAEDMELQAIREKLRDAERFLQQIDSALAVLTPVQRDIIERKYFYKQDWPVIDKSLGYSEEQRRRYHRDALRQIAIVLFGFGVVFAVDKRIV